MERLIIRPKRTTWGGAESAETAMLMGRLPDGAEVREKGLKAHGQKGRRAAGAQGLKSDGAEDRRGSGAEGMMSDGAEGEEPRA